MKTVGLISSQVSLTRFYSQCKEKGTSDFMGGLTSHLCTACFSDQTCRGTAIGTH